MRDIKRLDNAYEIIKEIHKRKFPDWRIGQLLFNFFSETDDPFYWEEDKFIKEFAAYAEKYGIKNK